jgi:hypothetical protein
MAQLSYFSGFIFFVLSFSNCKAQFNLSEQQFLIAELQEQPVALNQNNVAYLNSLGLLDSLQSNLLQSWLAQRPLESPYQLQGILSLDVSSIQMLMSCVFIEPPANTSIKILNQNQNNSPKHYNNPHGNFFVRYTPMQTTWLELQKDTTATANYLGSPFALTVKCNILFSNQISLSIVGAKDAGEPFNFSKKQIGFDYLVASVNYEPKQQVQKIAIGAYQFQWGQGLQLWTSRGMGRSIDLLQSVKIAQGLKIYRGLDEQRYLSGAACHFKWKDQHFFSLLSSKAIDVKTQLDTLVPAYFGMVSTGYHRSNSELETKKQIQENIWGFGWQSKVRQQQLGLLFLCQNHRSNTHTDSIGFLFLDQQDQFLLSLGCNASATFRNTYYYFEGVQNWSASNGFKGAQALITGALIHLHPKFQVGVQLRYYGLHFMSFYEQGFHAKSQANNEQGLFIQASYQMQRKLKCSAYLDQYQFTQLTTASFTSAQIYTRIQFLYTPTKQTQIQLAAQKIIGIQGQALSCAAQTSWKQSFEIQNHWQLHLVGLTALSYSTDFSILFKHLATLLDLSLHFGLFSVPAGQQANYLLLNSAGFGSQLQQLSGNGSYFKTSSQLKITKNFSAGFALGYLVKAPEYQCVNESYSYRPFTQQLQLNFQIKLKF